MTDFESSNKGSKRARAQTRPRLDKAKQAEPLKAAGRLQASHADANNFLGLMTPQGVVLAANRLGARIAGRYVEELVGMPVFEARWLQDTPGAAKAVRDAVQRAAAGDSVRIETAFGTDADGRTLDLSFEPVSDERGAVKFIVTQWRDLTDQVRTAAALKASEQFSRLVLENSPDCVQLAVSRDIAEQGPIELASGKLAAIVHTSVDAIVSKDLNGVITSWNEAAERIFGYPAAEAVGQPIMMLLPTELRDEERGIMAKIRRGERVEAYDARRRRKDGTQVEISVTISPILDPKGRIVGASKIARDITDRRATEAALHESELRVRLATEATGVGIWEWHLATNTIRWDAQLFHLYGIAPTPDRLVEYQTWAATVEPEDLPRSEAALQEMIQRRGKSTRDFRIRRRSDGQLRHIHAVETVRTDAQGRAEWVIGTNRDVTERRQMQEALTTADQHKDEFLATLAHELRNPLAPIRMGLEVLKRVDLSSAAAEQTRAMMDRQLRQLVRLVDDLMDVSRISSGRLELDKAPVLLSTVLHSALESCRPLMDKMGHEFSYIPSTEPLTVYADLTRLAQVFVNLLNNAAKYTPHGGRVRLSVERDGKEALVVIRDTGIGISPDALPYIFDMFTQVKGAPELAQGGLGIGLSLVKRLVALHDGKVEGRSSGVGAGSEFVVRLPLCESGDEQPTS